MDGPTAIAAIRALGFKGIILGLTGNVNATNQETMTKAGADGVLTKPLNIDIFWNTTRGLAGRLE